MLPSNITDFLVWSSLLLYCGLVAYWLAARNFGFPRKTLARSILFAGTCYVISAFAYLFVLSPHFSIETLHVDQAEIDYSKPFAVTFDRPVNKRELKYRMSAGLKGTWKFEKVSRFDIFKRRLVFYQESSLYPDDYTMFSMEYASLLGIRNDVHSVDVVDGITRRQYPRFTFSDEINNHQNIDPETTIPVYIDNFDRHSYEVSLVSVNEGDEPLRFNPQRNGNEYRFTHENDFLNGTQYYYNLVVTPVSRDLKSGAVMKQGIPMTYSSLKFKTALQPSVKAFIPNGDNVLVNEPIRIFFDRIMNRDSVKNGVKIEPAVEFTVDWNSDSTIVALLPTKPLMSGTKYTISLSKEIKTKYGAKLVQGTTRPTSGNPVVLAKNTSRDAFDASYTYEFKTAEDRAISRVTPAAGSMDVDINSSFSVEYSQSVDHTLVEKSFSIEPSIAGHTAWIGNVFMFIPDKPLDYAQEYKLAVYNYDQEQSSQTATVHYSVFTKNKVVLLNVPITNQFAQYACNVTAASIALTYKGINLSPQAIYDMLPKSDIGKRNGNHWGNPALGYVGDIASPDGQGYGVHWQPIQKILEQYRPAETKTAWNVTEMLREVDNGNVSVIWWQNGDANPEELSWESEDENGNPITVEAVKGMHSEVVVGYVGTPENPYQIILSDPWAGRWENKYHYVNIARFSYLWSTSFDNTAIVVR